MRQFNISGPNDPARHHTYPALQRLDNVKVMKKVMKLIEQQSCFVLHAPPQTGKTTAMLSLARKLNDSGKYAAALVSMKAGAELRDDVGAAELAIVNDWLSTAASGLPDGMKTLEWSETPPGARVESFLSEWAKGSSRPLVVFLDDVDLLENNVIISVLSQLRSGFTYHPKSFPASFALIGVRTVRNYKVVREGKREIGATGFFNIVAESFTLPNFNHDEALVLLMYHLIATRQKFGHGAHRLIFDLTQGHPHLVNALAKIMVEELATDTTRPILLEHIERAKELLIERRSAHLDDLIEKSREEGVRSVIEPLLAGEHPIITSREDLESAMELGLLRRDPEAGLVIANPIYREMLSRSGRRNAGKT
ncbi:MAG: AAA family ATPase [Blastocatellia bacterium]